MAKMPSVPGNAFHMISFIYSSHKNLQRNYHNCPQLTDTGKCGLTSLPITFLRHSYYVGKLRFWIKQDGDHVLLYCPVLALTTVNMVANWGAFPSDHFVSLWQKVISGKLLQRLGNPRPMAWIQQEPFCYIILWQKTAIQEKVCIYKIVRNHKRSRNPFHTSAHSWV